MRISDWSSDVCSSDLSLRRERPSLAEMLCVTARSGIVSREETGEPEPLVQGPVIGGPSQNIVARVVGVIAQGVLGAHRFLRGRHHLHEAYRRSARRYSTASGRTEEHPSELPYLT